MTLIYIILATLAVSLISFVGVLGLALSKKKLDNVLLVLVALAGGSLLGGAFLHLIPEAIHEIGHDHEQLQMIFIFVILGFLLFLLIEQGLHWHHCHTGEHGGKACADHSHKKPMSKLILIGDGVHNLIDGLIIAASFMVNPLVGLVTTIAVALHEIPQEIGDFGVLVYGGYNKTKALLFNFLSGLTAVFGGLIGYYFAEASGGVVLYLLPIAAGGFIYIAASDLVPEIKHGERASRLALNFSVFVAGILLMLLMKYLPFASH
ncbi:MAG: ZIP family metal transporter [Patescibacteria group bacterium]|nr:ZIP family metal transporter [Patescibacteria group bacterium]